MAPSKKKPKAGKAAVVAKKHTWQPDNVVVVLKNMKDRKKRSWNDHRAVVLEDNDPWYTVQPVSNRYGGLVESSEILKWRKKHTEYVYTIDEKRQDPAEILSIEVWGKIFSFLVDDRMHTIRGCHSHLCSVSKLWKDVFDQNMKKWDGLVHAWLGIFRASGQPTKDMSWMIRNQIHVKELVISEAICNDIPVLTEILTKCHTDRLTSLIAVINGYRTNLMVFRQIRETGIRPEARRENLKEFHDTIAKECPNLIHLEISLMLPAKSPCYNEYISRDLFSMPKMEALFVRLEYIDGDIDPEDGSIKLEGRVFTNVIENLPGLKSLSIQTAHQPVSNHTRYHIESSSLLVIDASALPKATYVSCKCPKLQQFICSGNNEESNGVAPKMPVGGWQSLRNTVDDVGVVLPRQFIDVPLEVPGTCAVILKDMFQYGFVDGHCFYEFAKNARYTTWQEN